MFVRWTRAARRQAARLIALAYILCVLAPVAALAAGTGSAPCLSDLQAASPAGMKMYETSAHRHGSMPHDAAAHHAGMLHDHHTEDGDKAADSRHDHGNAQALCCAMMCVSGLPAEFAAMAGISQPIAVDHTCPRMHLSGKDASPLYRPPIA